MKKLLLQLDSSRLPSVFDAVVAFDAGADEVMSRGGVAEEDVRDLVHGCIFTRGPKDLKNTAVFIGGTDMSKGEKLLAAAEKAVFGGFRISMKHDPRVEKQEIDTPMGKMTFAESMRRFGTSRK